MSGNKLKEMGKLDIKGMDIIKRVYAISGISPALTTMMGGQREPKIIIKFTEKPHR